MTTPIAVLHLNSKNNLNKCAFYALRAQLSINVFELQNHFMELKECFHCERLMFTLLNCIYDQNTHIHIYLNTLYIESCSGAFSMK